MKKLFIGLALVVVAAGGYAARATSREPPRPVSKEAPLSRGALGALAFADPNLSEPAGESCATCHDPKHAFIDPRGTPTSEGAIKGRFGPRNTPSIVYASFAPPLSGSGDEAGFSGGQFWDGRSDTLQEQMRGPLMNPLEMNNADAAMVLAKLEAAPYASQLVAIYGAFTTPDEALTHLADAISAYEAALPNRFTSKYDAYLAGTATLSAAETRGLRLFDDDKTGPCVQCHLDKRADDGSPPLFTDFGYDNIGIPHNPANPFYQLPAALNPEGPNAVDQGLGATTRNRDQMGQFKSPSLRNVAQTAPYGHNGYFKTLKEVVHFYNTRDVPGAWFPAEHKRGLNRAALGDLRLTDGEENDLVAFMETLTDGYSP